MFYCFMISYLCDNVPTGFCSSDLTLLGTTHWSMQTVAVVGPTPQQGKVQQKSRYPPVFKTRLNNNNIFIGTCRPDFFLNEQTNVLARYGEYLTWLAIKREERQTGMSQAGKSKKCFE